MSRISWLYVWHQYCYIVPTMSLLLISSFVKNEQQVSDQRCEYVNIKALKQDCYINKVLSVGTLTFAVKKLRVFHPSVPSEKWAAKQPALGLSAGTARTPPLQRSMSITRWNYPEGPTPYTAGQRKAQCWSDVDLFFMDYTEGFLTVSLSADMWGRAHLSQWFMNGYRPRCGSVDAGSLKGGRRLCIKGRSWKVQHQGRLTISHQ